MEFNKKLISLREEKNIDYKAISGGTGISVDRLKKFEQGDFKPTQKELYNLSLFYHVSIESFYADPLVSDYYARLNIGKIATICKFVIYALFLLYVFVPLSFYGIGKVMPDGGVEEVLVLTSPFREVATWVNALILAYVFIDIAYSAFMMLYSQKVTQKQNKWLRMLNYLALLGGLGCIGLYNLYIYSNTILTINRG